jgi:hypothetical protein
MAKKAKGQGRRRLRPVELFKDVPWFEIKGYVNNPPKFEGPLKQPILVKRITDPNLDELMWNIFNHRLNKLHLLLSHYALEDTDDPWLLLSLRLACAFVPGFKVKRKGRGAPGKWKDNMDDLIAAVEAEKKKSGGGVAKAIDRLKQNDPVRWKSFNEPRYYELLTLRKLKALFS